jgi:hypothetical protein
MGGRRGRLTFEISSSSTHRLELGSGPCVTLSA